MVIAQSFFLEMRSVFLDDRYRGLNIETDFFVYYFMITDFQKKIYPVRKNRRNSDKKAISEFSNEVYRVVKKIPKGEVMTYMEVAKAVGRPRAYRAVGNALNKNTDKYVPCHRVIRSDGSLGGYSKGVKKKITLLRKEGLKI